ncbi:hypothetical protein [Nonomuraea rubra]|uniref:Transposase n=1 Tax=Nonomuraea rubra TaxID=46180 RepID=A0A7X0P164_9ACTN|nr:hypothetical protein [Nonomuraea rubra]MBB6553360.1 transposase [Nonomuraea rubra]
MTHPDHLREAEAEHLAKILDRSPELAATAGHVRAFATMLTERTGRQHLDGWLTAVRADPLPALHSLANGIERETTPPSWPGSPSPTHQALSRALYEDH